MLYEQKRKEGETMKQKLYSVVDSLKETLWDLSDQIHDHPEIGFQEYFAVGLLTDCLKKHGFSVETGIYGAPTSFRCVYQIGEGGPSIGLLCEYDALRGLGHGCAHHMQGPVAVGAAIALKEVLDASTPCKIVVYGCPDEEGAAAGGKLVMCENGGFRDIDVALISHGSANTQADRQSLARVKFNVDFSGPDGLEATSATEAMLLAFQAFEFMREHVKDDTRLHYCPIQESGQPGIVSNHAKATFEIRSRSNGRLDTMVDWVKDIVRAACMMTETTFTISKESKYYGKFPVEILHELFYANAEQADAHKIAPPRPRTGSTDFGNVMQVVPGIGIRLCIMEENYPIHSQEWVDAGKGDRCHQAILDGAKILAGMSLDLAQDPAKLQRMKEEYVVAKAEAAAN